MLNAELERKQMRINATHGADCVGRFRKIANGTGNFDLYYYPEGGYVMSVAKCGSGCRLFPLICGGIKNNLQYTEGEK